MQEKRGVLKHFAENILQGLFWLLPAAVIVFIIFWLYGKVDALTYRLFEFIGFEIDGNSFLWILLTIIILIVTLYIVGFAVNTKIASLFEALFTKIPFYSTLKDIINIFNSSKKGETKVLVVAIRGFGNVGYNIGLMYSQKESIIKDHYTVTLSQSPIPNGGFMFEMHKKDIFVIQNATFDNNLQYLLSMGVKSLAEILKTEPINIDELTPLEVWIDSKQTVKKVKNVKAQK
ncbi:MAG: DUF502 domain-containing protein [Campylobacteraceae bacterium]|jgi:uncharacterized membrane protein|nr:DUF502 domain-containing protein [Campylobacteraceae bacterium]